MSGFRGIFLDAMHPLIVRRLDADTNALTFRGPNQAMTDLDQTAAFRYFQERTPWIRVCPFAIPQTTFLANPNLSIYNIPEVPDWRDWIIWGGKGINHGGGYQTVEGGEAGTDTSVSGDAGGRQWVAGRPYGSAADWKANGFNEDIGVRHSAGNVAGIGNSGHSLYRSTAQGWRGQDVLGMKSSPVPGILALNVSNKGDLGTIRRASFDIKVFNTDDLEAIEMMYMIPGISVLVEWGWFHPTKYIDPINVELITDGSTLSNTNLINTEILRKSYGITKGLPGDARPLYNLEEQANAVITDPTGPDAGIYDGLLGVVTKFNWTNDGAGGYDCRVDVVSPGSLATGIPAVSFECGGEMEVEGKKIQVSDVRTIVSLIKKESRAIESAPAEQNASKQSKNNIGKIELGDPAGEQDVAIDGGGESGVTVKINPKKLNTSSYNIKITKDQNGDLQFEESSGKSSKEEYFIGEFKGGKRQKVTAIKGDRTWWNKCVAYCMYADDIKAAGINLSDARKGLVDMSKITRPNGAKPDLDYLEDRFQNSKVSDFLWSGGANDNGMANMELKWGDQLRDGDFFIKKDPKPKKAGSTTGKNYTIYIITFSGVVDHTTSGNNLYLNYRNWFNPWGVKKLIPKMEDPGQEDIDLGKRTLKASVEGIKGYMSKQAAAKKYGWKTTDDGKTYVDETGAKVTWGEYGPYAVEQQTGITVYTKDDNGNYKEVASFEGDNAKSDDQLVADLVAKAKGIDNQKADDRKNELNENMKVDAEITNTAQNLGMLSWVNSDDFKSGKKPVRLSGSGKFHKVIYANNQPVHAPKIGGLDSKVRENVTEELGYDFVMGKTANLLPVGAVVYGNTYITWRFIEDYIINELYMPKAVKPGQNEENDNNTTLDTLFRSCARMTDNEKATLDPDVAKLVGVEFDDDGLLTPQSRNREVWKPVHIVNHSGLRSLDPTVCYIPGQETLDAMIITENGSSGGSGGEHLLDAGLSGASKYLKGEDCFNKFIGLGPNGLPTVPTNSGILRNIMINADLVLEAAEKSENVRKFCLTILDAVNVACGKPWSFKILTNSALGQISVIDENYTPSEFVDDYSSGWTGMQEVNGYKIYKFAAAGINNVLRDVKIQSKIPNELATMAYYGTMGTGNEKGSAIQMFQMYGAGISDRLKSISSIKILGSTTGSAEDRQAAEEKLLNSYRNLLGDTRRIELNGTDETEPIEEGVRIAEQYVRKYIHGDTQTVGSYRPPIPIDVSLTLHGISGIYMGNAIHIKTTSEGGILPDRYRDTVALQITSVDHSVSPEDWSTSIGTLMRPISDSGNKPEAKIIEQPPTEYKKKTVFKSGGANGPKDNKSLDALHPVVAAAWLRVKAKLEADGWQPQVVTCFRSLKSQAEKASSGKSQVTFGNHCAINEKGEPNSQAMDIIDSRYSYGNNKKTIAQIGKKATKDKAFKFWAEMARYGKMEGFSWGGDFSWKGNKYKKNGDYDPDASKVNTKKKYSPTHIGWDPGHLEMIGKTVAGTKMPSMRQSAKTASKFYGRKIHTKSEDNPNINLV